MDEGDPLVRRRLEAFQGQETEDDISSLSSEDHLELMRYIEDMLQAEMASACK